MMFYMTVDNALRSSRSALSQLNSYNHYDHARSPRNASIRNNARLTIDPLVSQLRYAASNARYDGVSWRNTNRAYDAAQLLQDATWSLSDLPDRGRPTNVYQAQRQIRDAVRLLERARY